MNVFSPSLSKTAAIFTDQLMLADRKNCVVSVLWAQAKIPVDEEYACVLLCDIHNKINKNKLNNQLLRSPASTCATNSSYLVATR